MQNNSETVKTVSHAPASYQKPWRKYSEILEESLEYVAKRARKEIKSLKTSWDGFNSIGLNGIEWQSLYVLAARPGVGKTLVAATLTRSLQENNKDQDFMVLHFQFEMLGRNMGVRELSASNNLDIRYLQSAQDDGMPPLSKADYEKLSIYVGKQKAWKLADEPFTLNKEKASNWKPGDWNLEKHLPLDKLKTTEEKSAVALSKDEKDWIEAWNEFVLLMREKLGDSSLPGFPIWADHWVHIDELKIPRGTPDWKKNFLIKNAEFYTAHRVLLNKWLKKWNHLENFPPSRRKLEWQAQDTKSLWETIMHFRPSGIRAKKATYVPALVAITQTSIIGKQKRRITVREGSRLQGLPEWFDFVDQGNPQSYKQLGNGVNVGAVYNVIRAQVLRDLDLLEQKTLLTRSILGAPANPDVALESHKKYFTNKSKLSGQIKIEVSKIKKAN